MNNTDDVLTISNFKWGQATYTFKFADGAEGYIDKDTWQLVLTKHPDVIEEETEETSLDYENASDLEESETEDETSTDETSTSNTDIDTTEITDNIEYDIVA